MNNERKHIGFIEQGTVIDHIHNESIFKIIRILKLDYSQALVFVGFNLDSKRISKKGLIKIEEIFLDDETLSKIALIAPDATINIIKDSKVTEKKKLILPDSFQGLMKCTNYNCITNKENVHTKFLVQDKINRIFQCYFCETKIHDNEIEIIREIKEKT
ncbi:aspartate carbamoyltransferase regulatory subunit [Candidatus Woesearchaeota archaeon]|nr:aspartate carbamoyltransferase regulatory subunit [Candidatus Woesearchaeota archaeon]